MVLLQADPLLGMYAYLMFNLVRAAPLVVGPLLPGARGSWLSRLGMPVRALDLIVAVSATIVTILVSAG